MEGRWTISKKSTSSLSPPYRDHVRGPEAENVPVVPCDDGAIRRVAAALKTIPLMDVAEEPYATAERLLRAAGETP